MAQDIPETTYVPEVVEDARKERERRAVQEGTVSWRRRKEELQRQKHREQRELQQILENYSPWGKPGGGAPCAATLRKKNVPLEPLELSKCHNFGQGWTSNSTIERLHRRSINPLPVTDMNKFFDDKAEPGIATDMQLVEDSKNPYNEEIQVYELTGGVELVPLLTSRRYYSQPQCIRHVVTDATRPGYTIESCVRACAGITGIPTSKIVKRNELLLPILLSSKTLLATSVHDHQRTKADRRAKKGRRNSHARKTVCNIACHAKWGEAAVRLNAAFKHLQCSIIFQGNTR
ncbi:PREDICTED: uncharacterized protein LOC108546382 isoform X1 [Eufriesea mexicana]|uniref:uncharacterized protein LOC108546382 isoform X1 n=1 Tax=Eufriesea mexicana TaxID=516756 RepID=UPI00083C62C7|nr:PREDICTED: uncharacterized protein LOC108546382 isoform X1 [Eufriesea mexicana]